MGIGVQALLQQTSSAGYGNTAVGFQSMNGAITTAAVGNTALGASALKAITTGQRNTGIGNQAGLFITTGQFNSCVGRTSCGAVQVTALTGNDNSALGDSALGNINSGAADNTGIGFKAGNAMTTNSNFTGVGSNAGLLVTGGSNTIIGAQVGSTTLTTGTGNILIGTSSTTTTNGSGDTNSIAIGAAGLGSSTLTIAGIYTATSTGTASTSVPSISGTVDMPNLASSSSAQTGTVCWLTGSGVTAGRLTVDTTTTCLASLEELKNIKGFITNGLDIVSKMNPFWFQWKDDTEQYTGDKREQPGLGAHAVEAIDPRLVGYDANGKLKGVRYNELTAVLVAAIKDQQAEIKSLNNQIIALGGKPIAMPTNDNWLQRTIKKALNL